MLKTTSLALFIVLALSACAAQQSPPIAKQARLDCEQQAEVAQAQYLARIKTPMYTSSFSSTWAGGARSDTGMWVFDATLQACVLHARHAGEQ